MKTFKEYRRIGGDDRTDQYVYDEIKRRKLARHIVNMTDDDKMIRPPNKPAFSFPNHIGSSFLHVYLKKLDGPTKGVYAFNYRAEI